ncbi:MAG: hypothetical protein ABL903_07910 [Methylococcales bacterium]
MWAASEPEKLSPTLQNLLSNAENELFFSPINLWEIAIKTQLGRPDFQVSARRLWRQLLLHGYRD